MVKYNPVHPEKPQCRGGWEPSFYIFGRVLEFFQLLHYTPIVHDFLKLIYMPKYLLTPILIKKYTQNEKFN
jgi:hypothetical protein